METSNDVIMPASQHQEVNQYYLLQSTCMMAWTVRVASLPVSAPKLTKREDVSRNTRSTLLLPGVIRAVKAAAKGASVSIMSDGCMRHMQRLMSTYSSEDSRMEPMMPMGMATSGACTCHEQPCLMHVQHVMSMESLETEDMGL